MEEKEIEDDSKYIEEMKLRTALRYSNRSIEETAMLLSNDIKNAVEDANKNDIKVLPVKNKVKGDK